MIPHGGNPMGLEPYTTYFHVIVDNEDKTSTYLASNVFTDTLYCYATFPTIDVPNDKYPGTWVTNSGITTAGQLDSETPKYSSKPVAGGTKFLLESFPGKVQHFYKYVFNKPKIFYNSRIEDTQW